MADPRRVDPSWNDSPDPSDRDRRPGVHEGSTVWSVSTAREPSAGAAPMRRYWARKLAAAFAQGSPPRIAQTETGAPVNRHRDRDAGGRIHIEPPSECGRHEAEIHGLRRGARVPDRCHCSQLLAGNDAGVVAVGIDQEVGTPRDRVAQPARLAFEILFGTGLPNQLRRLRQIRARRR